MKPVDVLYGIAEAKRVHSVWGGRYIIHLSIRKAPQLMCLNQSLVDQVIHKLRLEINKNIQQDHVLVLSNNKIVLYKERGYIV